MYSTQPLSTIAHAHSRARVYLRPLRPLRPGARVYWGSRISRASALRPHRVRSLARARFFFFFFLKERKKKVGIVKPAAFARILGVNRSTVTRAIQAGRLVADEQGMLDVDANLRSWEATKHGSRPDVAQRHAANRPPALSQPSSASDRPANSAASLPVEPFREPGIEPTADDQDLDEPQTSTGSLAYYTARRLAAQNNLLKLGMKLRNGQRYPLDAVRRESLSIGGSLRASLERLVDQTAPRLAVLTDSAERRRLIASETRQLRRDISREFLRALRRLRNPTGARP